MISARLSLALAAAVALVPAVQAAVEGGTLKLRFRRGLSVTGRPGIRAVVTAPALESLKVDGAGRIAGAGTSKPLP